MPLLVIDRAVALHDHCTVLFALTDALLFIASYA
jgi:hypothetical protein